MGKLFPKSLFPKKDVAIATSSNASYSEGKYTEEDILKALGINEKLIKNEETNLSLKQMLEAVENIDVSQIKSQEDFNKAMQIYRREIEVSKQGNEVLGIINRSENSCRIHHMELGRENELQRDTTVLNVLNEGNKTIKDVEQKDAKIEIREGDDYFYNFVRRKKSIIEPGNFDGMITMDMMKDIRNIKQWNSEKNEIDNSYFYDVQSVMKYDDQMNPYSRDKAQQFRDSFRREHEQYSDGQNKLDPTIVKDSNMLKRNILEEIGVSKKILEKSGLLVELEQLVDYAAQGKQLQTKEEIDSVVKKLQETTEVTDTQVSGIKGNRKYLDANKRSLDVTEGVKISVLDNNEYEVENTKFGRAFIDESGNLDLRQQSTRTIYREDYADNSILEKTKREQKSARCIQNVGENYENNRDDKQTSEQYDYLNDTKPLKYLALQTMLQGVAYKETWRDTRTKEQQKLDDLER